MYEFLSLTKDDVEVIKKQLGSDKVCAAALVERCPYGYPSIILVRPPAALTGTDPESKNYRLIANLLWLTCPHLNQKIHDLETRGYIGKISSFINRDKNMQSLMKDAHAEYHFLRKYACRKYSSDDKGDYADGPAIVNTGIGGIKNLEHLKCLHLHYAHYRLCEKNIAGRIVNGLLDGNITCTEVSCRNVP